MFTFNQVKIFEVFQNKLEVLDLVDIGFPQVYDRSNRIDNMENFSFFRTFRLST